MEQFTQKFKIAKNVLNIGLSNKSCHITFSSKKKVISFESEEKNAQIKHYLSGNKYKQLDQHWILMRAQKGIHFFSLEGVWTHLAKDNCWKLNALMIDLFLTNTAFT